MNDVNPFTVQCKRVPETPTMRRTLSHGIVLR